MRKKGSKSSRRLLDVNAVVMAQTKTMKALLRWAGEYLPEHRADADQSVDPVEQHGFSVAREDGIPAEPSGCLGFACPRKSDDCGHCEFTEANAEGWDPLLFYEKLTRDGNEICVLGRMSW